MTTTTSKRTITLTDHAPVTITESRWPVIAKATGDSYGSRDYSRYQQALAQGELDKWSLRVRQHADGRRIVYAIYDAATAWTGETDRRGGELLSVDDDVIDAIRRVGEDCGIPDRTIRECIADLPAENID